MARLRALALSTHPGPALTVTAVTVLLAIAAGLDPWRIAVLGLVMLCNQASVGLSNDWLDADRDRAVARTDKPVARGDLPAAVARNAAIGLATASVVLSLALGWAAVVAHLIFLVSAWAYNAGLKNSPVSVVPYITAFGTLPALVTLAADPPVIAAATTIAAGALLGVAAHFANVLPDLADDAATGVRGLPHRLGRVASQVAIWVALPAAAACLALGSPTPAGVAGLVIAVVLAVAGLVLGLRRAPTRVIFRLVMAAALIDVVLLVLGGAA
ncbi:MAG TPA: UbiA family prenyltransferase [Pseudolysinimonas sp.]|jgi:4-hydroxybenzoate polyprenyltransferase|nr:UbiA family prenyltransferase [Pseudolysinimonas sp.]